MAVRQQLQLHLLVNECSEFWSVIGPGGLAVEAPGGEAEGGVWSRRAGGEEEAVGNVRQLRTRSAEKPALETAAPTGELPAFWHLWSC